MATLLAQDLDFKGAVGTHPSHSLHAFAARFPPQLPACVIEALSSPGEMVADPMMGSGTTLLEAYLHGRPSRGSDLDALAVRLARVKTTPLDPALLADGSTRALAEARRLLVTADLDRERERRFPPAARQFLDYWFLPETQRELMALALAIERVNAAPLREFLQVAFSGVIVTKSGGVSLARDLAHSRPHRVAKRPRSALEQFAVRTEKNIQALAALPPDGSPVEVARADARALPWPNESVDLIVTSPPYANAIDYVRAHKFSLVWLGEPLDHLARQRGCYIGAERLRDVDGDLPPLPHAMVEQLAAPDPRRARVLRQYFLDMGRSLAEMFRVLRPGRAAVMVVGSSTMRGVDVQTPFCLAELAAAAGFERVGIAERRLDRDRRMLPARHPQAVGSGAGIERRMHREHVLGLFRRA
ncbi:MAG: hypothetical protein HY320_05830 [Armatimonadetes bacterium]|nr:hypothetical protein [Armatimonadota bacterium]